MTPPRKIRYAGPDWRNDVHAFHLAKMLGVDKIEKTEGRGLWLDESVAYGALRRNTMAKAISDLIQAIEDGKRPECGAREYPSGTRNHRRPRRNKPLTPESKALARRYLDEVIESGVCSGMRVSLPEGGRFLQLLEAEYRALFGMPYAVARNSATSGLHMALVAAGV